MKIIKEHEALAPLRRALAPPEAAPPVIYPRGGCFGSAGVLDSLCTSFASKRRIMALREALSRGTSGPIEAWMELHCPYLTPFGTVVT